ncbi:energy-coupled thiamine transporter ThiT [Evansella sp. AB-rgal1]|uniref:energy-coupled thiamine transporter ThiT n=1 Tax=Evansella sp. AB-rgal1 TaxID=3242696 RepID=UPI00359DCEE2
MQKTRPVVIMAEIAIMAALAFILDLLTLLKFWPQGGSISLAMLPIFVMALRRGLKPGLLTGLIYGILNWNYDPYIVHWLQGLIDYPIAFFVVGFAGLITVKEEMPRWKQALYITLAVLIGSVLRFAAAFTSGIVWFGIYAPEGTPVAWYSFTYNISYLGPTFLVCLGAILLLANVNKRILHPNA